MVNSIGEHQLENSIAQKFQPLIVGNIFPLLIPEARVAESFFQQRGLTENILNTGFQRLQK